MIYVLVMIISTQIYPPEIVGMQAFKYATECEDKVRELNHLFAFVPKTDFECIHVRDIQNGERR